MHAGDRRWRLRYDGFGYRRLRLRGTGVGVGATRLRPRGRGFTLQRGQASVVRQQRRAKGQHTQDGHLESAARVGGVRQVALAIERHLVEKLRVFRGQRGGKIHYTLCITAAGIGVIGQHLGNRNPVQKAQQFRQCGVEIRCMFRHVRDRGECSRCVARRHGLQHGIHEGHIHRAQHAAHTRLGDTTGTECDGLISEAQGVAHAAISRAPQQPQRRFLVADHLGIQHHRQVRRDLLWHHVLQVELQTARQHRSRQLLGIGCGEQKLDVRRRLFERFQQRIEAAVGQHMDFVDQIDLVARTRGRILHIFQQFPRVLHLGARGCVDLEQIYTAPLGDFQTGTAAAAGFRTNACFAVQAFGENSRDRGLAHAARAGKQVRVMQAVVVQRVHQRLQYVFLAHHFAETTGPPLACEYLIGHVRLALPKSAKDTPPPGKGHRQFGKEATRAATPRHTHQ